MKKHNLFSEPKPSKQLFVATECCYVVCVYWEKFAPLVFVITFQAMVWNSGVNKRKSICIITFIHKFENYYIEIQQTTCVRVHSYEPLWISQVWLILLSNQWKEKLRWIESSSSDASLSFLYTFVKPEPGDRSQKESGIWVCPILCMVFFPLRNWRVQLIISKLLKKQRPGWVSHVTITSSTNPQISLHNFWVLHMLLKT